MRFTSGRRWKGIGAILGTKQFALTSAVLTGLADPLCQVISESGALWRCRCGACGITPAHCCTRSFTFMLRTTIAFLQKGLQFTFIPNWAGDPAFPNFGEDLRRSAARSLSEVKSLATLNSVRTPVPLSSVMDEQTAYVLAGSFVGFLIERYGLPPFRSLYETESYEKVYGKSVDTLEKEWRLRLQGK